VRGPIGGGVDGSEVSRLAVEEAASLATGSRQTVVVVFVRHAPLAALGVLATAGHGVGVLQDALNVDEALAEAQSIAILESACVCWRFEVRTGEPAAELMRVATEFDADTIVVAGRRHGALGGFAHGSVSMQLLHRWTRSLFVIHPRPAAADNASADVAVQ
jgi:nucleotide-binding universal stress UspA family protein